MKSLNGTQHGDSISRCYRRRWSEGGLGRCDILDRERDLLFAFFFLSLLVFWGGAANVRMLAVLNMVE